LVGAGVLRFDTTLWQPSAAIRCSLGVAIPVVFAILTHHTAYGTLAGLGALYVGFASYRGVYRSRLRAMFLTLLATTLMTVIGSLVGVSDIATLIVVPLVAFVFSLYATSSVLASSIATQAVCILVVLAGLHLPPGSAFGNGGLLAGGGLFQIFLLTVMWPVNPRFPERKAVADAYFSLSQFLDGLPKGHHEIIPGSQLFEDARAILQEARTFRWRNEHEQMVELMRAAESLRAASVGFAQATENLVGSECEAAADLCEALAKVMSLESERIRTGRFGDLSLPENALPDLPNLPAALDHWYQLLKRQLGDLGHEHPHMMDDPLTAPREGQGWHKGFAFLTKLPDASSLRHVALGHAIRFTVTLEVALLLSRAIHERHLYWLPLTVAIVLRADFASTVTRGASRLVGTLAGVILAGGLVSLFHPSSDLFGILSLLSTWFCFAFFQPNYALYSVAITCYVVFSVGSASLNLHHPSAALIRLAATLVGSAISVAAYVLWPAFQGRELREVIGEALEAQIQFGEKMKAWNPNQPQEVEDARNHARQLRLRSENLFQTAALEPWGISGPDLQTSRDAILRLDENAAELLALRAEQEADPAEIDRVLSSSKSLKDRLLAG
jgi:uncharacterized membrane protein YccC